MSIHIHHAKFMVHWRESGKQKAKSFPTKQEAEEFEKQTAARLYRHAVVGRINSVNRPLEALASEWLNSRAIAPITRKSYERSIFKPFLEHFQGRYIHNINFLDLEAYFAQRKQQVMPMTAKKEFLIIRDFFGAMQELLLLPSNPMKLVKNLRGVKPTRKLPLSYAQETKLITAVTPYQAAKVLLALDCGLRAGNLPRLTRAAIDYDDASLTFHVLKKRVAREMDAETRTLPLTDRLFGSLIQFKDLPTSQHLFTYQNETVKDPTKFIKKLWPRLGFRFNWHLLRHTFYTRLLNASDNYPLAEWAMGHAVTTYYHPELTPEKIRQAFTAMDLQRQDAMLEIQNQENTWKTHTNR